MWSIAVVVLVCSMADPSCETPISSAALGKANSLADCLGGAQMTWARTALVPGPSERLVIRCTRNLQQDANGSIPNREPRP